MPDQMIETKVAGNIPVTAPDGTATRAIERLRSSPADAQFSTSIFGLSIATRQDRTIGVAPPKSDTWLHQNELLMSVSRPRDVAPGAKSQHPSGARAIRLDVGFRDFTDERHWWSRGGSNS